LADRTSPPSHTRAASLDRLTERVDVLVVGGGIVGSGVARDAAMRGLSVALVEQNDFASGTSSRSSRLLHGGLRYLAQGRVRLVREASKEKLTVHTIAPHLAQPLPFILPTYRGNRDWPRWKLRIGVKMYDLLCGRGNLGKSGGLSPEETRQLLPGVNADDLSGAVRYYDAFTSDARLVLDTIRSAARHSAAVLNYVKLESAKLDQGTWHCGLRDRSGNRTIALAARAVVNAAGPWADQLPASKVRLRLSKGVHLVITRERLNVPEAVVMTDGKRILFAIPWGERVILGTTDTDYAAEDLEHPRCEPKDVQYVLGVVNRAFPHASLSPKDVISTWTGLRPLIADPSGAPSDVSREHEIKMPSPGWFDVAGGKLTTYRLMAEQAVDRIVKHLGIAARPCTTASEPLLPEAKPPFSGVTPPPVSRDAVEQFCREEWALHLDDVMIRRSSWQYYHCGATSVARTVNNWMSEILGWDSTQASTEWKRYATIARTLQCDAGGDDDPAKPSSSAGENAQCPESSPR
jgi:glycerol-3-phosphate dehydrogenase